MFNRIQFLILIDTTRQKPNANTVNQLLLATNLFRDLPEVNWFAGNGK